MVGDSIGAYKENGIGPRTEPWGTPRSADEDVRWLIWILKYLFDK